MTIEPDNPYHAAPAVRSQAVPRVGRKRFLAGLILMVVGTVFQIYARFALSNAIMDLMTAPAGINPSTLPQRFYDWSYIGTAGSAATILGLIILAHGAWKLLAASSE